MATISVHKALADRKIIPARINRILMDTKFALANRATNTKINGASIEDTQKNMLAAMDSLVSLLECERDTLFAVARSNSTAKITIGTLDLTVTEAIQLKKHMATRRSVLDRLKRDLRDANNKVAAENDALPEKAAQFAKANTGDKSAIAKPEQLQGMIEVYTKANEYQLIDPIGLQKRIADMEDEILLFESEVDAKLSEVNATTLIEIKAAIPAK